MKRLSIIGGIVLGIAAIALIMSTYVVDERRQALIIAFGNPKAVVQEPGLHFKAPWYDTRFFDDRLLDYDAPQQEIPTVDQKQVIVDAYARYQIDDPLLFFQRVTDVRQAEARLANVINANLREVLGSVPLSRILTEQRSDLMDQITQLVRAEGRTFGIAVADVRIKRVDLPEENSQAIFRRMQTQREQEARRVRAEGERDARVIRAQADRDARVILAEAQRKARVLRGEGDAQAEAVYREGYGRDLAFFDYYRKLQAARTLMDRDTTQYIGPPNADILRLFDGVTSRVQQALPDMPRGAPNLGQLPEDGAPAAE